jgi:WD40 repeat protein
LLYLNHGSVAALTGDKDLLLLKPACEQRFVGQQGAMNAAAVSPDGKLLYTGGNEPLLRVWNTATGQQISSAAITAGVQQLRVSAQGNQVVAAGLDGKLSRWEAAAFKKEQAGSAAVSIQLPNVAHGLSLSPDGQRAVTGGDDGWLRHFDLTSGQELERQGPLAAAVLSSAWAVETGLVLASSADKLVTRNRLGILQTHAAFKEPVRALALSGDGARLASGDANGKLSIATLASGATIAQQLPSKAIHSLAWSPDDKELAIATAEGILLVTVRPVARQLGTRAAKDDK